MPEKKYTKTEEHQEKITHKLKGKKQTEEHIRKRIAKIFNKK